jgi:hypothetical protein
MRLGDRHERDLTRLTARALRRLRDALPNCGEIGCDAHGSDKIVMQSAESRA